MADEDFRVKFPYESNVIITPISVTTEEPTFTSINQLSITDNIPIGTYTLTVTYEWSMPDINDSAIFRIISPVSQGTEFKQEPKALDDLILKSFVGEHQWSGGPILFDFQAAITAGGQPLNVVISQIIFERKK